MNDNKRCEAIEKCETLARIEACIRENPILLTFAKRLLAQIEAEGSPKGDTK